MTNSESDSDFIQNIKLILTAMILIFFVFFVVSFLNLITYDRNIFAVIILFILILYLIVNAYQKINQKKEIRPRPGRKVITRALEYYKQLDGRTQQRENYILLAQSMLLLSIVTALTLVPLNDDIFSIPIAIAIVGIVITLLWYLANVRLIRQADVLINNYMFHDEIIRVSITSVRHQPSAVLFLHDILPGSIFILWIYLLYYSVYQIDIYGFVMEIFPYYLLGFLGGGILYKVLLPRRK